MQLITALQEFKTINPNDKTLGEIPPCSLKRIMLTNFGPPKNIIPPVLKGGRATN